jgi:hypothetical protein
MALGRLPPAHLAACGCTQIGQIWIGSAALVPKQDRLQSGGYRAVAAASDGDAVLQPIRSMSDLIADSALANSQMQVSRAAHRSAVSERSQAGSSALKCLTALRHRTVGPTGIDKASPPQRPPGSQIWVITIDEDWLRTRREALPQESYSARQTCQPTCEGTGQAPTVPDAAGCERHRRRAL